MGIYRAKLLHEKLQFFYMDKLAKQGYQCFAPNQRGYGRSSKPEGSQSYDTDILVSDVVDFIEKKTRRKTKVTLVIHDWGAAVGYKLAAEYPDLIKNIVAVNGPSQHGLVKAFKENPLQLFSSYYIAFFQLPFLPEMFFSLYDWAVWKKI